MVEAFKSRGWARFGWDARVADWVSSARPVAEAAVTDPANAEWLQCDGTWFVGVDALPNDAKGRVAGGPALSGPAVDLWHRMGHTMPSLHRAQVSVTWPGYPRPRQGEGEGAFRYRLTRDAAHVDGLLPIGPDRRRHLREPHAFVLGMALNDAPSDAAPLVVWDQSHRIMAEHLLPLFANGASDPDLTDAYHAARKQCFATCARIPLPLRQGESVILHRLCLHGVSPWDASLNPNEASRMIAYFRPEWPGGVQEWITQG